MNSSLRMQAVLLATALLPFESLAQAPKVGPGGGFVVNAVDNDPANKIWNCATNRVSFGNETHDKSRCFTFRYQVPAGGIKSATLHLGVRPLDGLASNDAIVIGTAKMFPSCSWAGPTPCVIVMGGPFKNVEVLDINLFGVTSAPNVTGNTPEAQQDVMAQLNSGVVHGMLQDDTAVYCAQLVINGGTGESPCTRANPGGGGSPAARIIPGGAAPTPTGADLPMPPFGTPEPTTNVQGMTLQGGQRRVKANQLVTVPFFLINSANLANMNFEVLYNLDVVKAEGQISKGNLLDQALMSWNPKVSGIVRAGFAQKTGMSGTGTVMNVPFRAVGKPGDSTRLHLVVTTINTPDGAQPTIYRIPGEIAIVDDAGNFPPGGGGGGPGTGGPGTGGPGTGGPAGGGPGAGGLLKGDCDPDGRLTTIDATCALQISVQLRPVDLVVDMDDSKDVTSRDATMIMQRVMGR